MNKDKQPGTISTLARLRSLNPHRGLELEEALGIAERQAATLLQLSGISEGPVPLTVLSDLPRIELVTEADLPSSGMSYWTNEAWRLVARAGEHPNRQRFSLAHEYKHVIDHPCRDLLYADHRTRELVADHFAACLLMPRAWITRAWCAGEQNITALADLFVVSPAAMERRLRTLGHLQGPGVGGYRCSRGSNQALLPRQPLAIAGHAPNPRGRP
jgi:hypothetical protein